MEGTRTVQTIQGITVVVPMIPKYGAGEAWNYFCTSSFSYAFDYSATAVVWFHGPANS